MTLRALMGGVSMAVVAYLAGVAMLRGRADAEFAGSSPGLPVETERIEQTLQLTNSERGWLGVVIAEESVSLAARFEGRVETVRVQVGARVRQGEVLALLDSQSARQEVAVAEAELLSSQAELRVAALTLEENQERLKRRDSAEQVRTGAISAEELSVARTQERMAAAKLEIARALVTRQDARVVQLRQRVAESSIRAPFDGVVASRFTHPGALLQPGQPIIHLLRDGAPRVRFAVPASQLRQVPVGRHMLLEVAEQALVLRGRTIQVAPEVDVASLMVFAVAEVEVPNGVVVPAGTVVRVKEEQPQEPGSLRESSSARLDSSRP